VKLTQEQLIMKSFRIEVADVDHNHVILLSYKEIQQLKLFFGSLSTDKVKQIVNNCHPEEFKPLKKPAGSKKIIFDWIYRLWRCLKYGNDCDGDDPLRHA